MARRKASRRAKNPHAGWSKPAAPELSVRAFPTATIAAGFRSDVPESQHLRSNLHRAGPQFPDNIFGFDESGDAFRREAFVKDVRQCRGPCQPQLCILAADEPELCQGIGNLCQVARGARPRNTVMAASNGAGSAATATAASFTGEPPAPGRAVVRIFPRRLLLTQRQFAEDSAIGVVNAPESLRIGIRAELLQQPCVGAF
jgi:hypothetical protein